MGNAWALDIGNTSKKQVILVTGNKKNDYIRPYTPPKYSPAHYELCW